MVSSSKVIVFQFPPFRSEIRHLSTLLGCADDDTRIQSCLGVTWPDSGLQETNGFLVRVIQAGENVPAAAFALNGPDGVLEVLLQVVVGPEILHRAGLHEVVVPEEGQDER